MINKFYKTIHNKYLKFFRFIFFLRYLLSIFFISFALFLIIPNYFNYEKRSEAVKTHLLKNYNFKTNKIGKIKYRALPRPSLELQNVQIYLGKTQIESTVKSLRIYPKLFSIYDYDNFQTKKIILNKNNINLNLSDIKFLLNFIFNQKEKFIIEYLDLAINDEFQSIIKFKNIKFSNYGYYKNLIFGEVFDKKFKIKIEKDFQSLNFKLLNSGIKVKINLKETSKRELLAGIIKAKILDSKLKFNFEYDYEVLNIFNSYFRNNYLSFNNKSSIILSPYFNISSKFDIQEINFKKIKNINFKKLLESKNLIKKINSKNNFNFISKKFSRDKIDNLNLQIQTAFGRMNYVKKVSIEDNHFECQGNINLLEQYPLLFFNCSVTSNEKEKLLREFSIKIKTKNEPLMLNVSGNLNILKKEINLKKINMNNSYEASKEDMIYFEKSFERILFDENFLKIFNYKKIKEFILDIS